MASLQDFRKQHPEYGDMGDSALADALYKKFYSDLPREDFNAKVGYSPTAAKVQESGGLSEFVKSIPTGVANLATSFARGEQLESEQRASAFGQPNSGPEVPTGEAAQKAFGLHKPEGFAGTAGELTGEYLANPLTYFGPGSAVGKFLTSAAAIFGAAGGKEATKGTSLEKVGELSGAAVGGFTPATVAKLASPVFINQARQAAAQVLEAEGVTALTAGQRTGNKATQYWEGSLGDAPFAGAKSTAAQEQSGRQFTAAVLRRAGENADLATPPVIDGAFRRIGGAMDAAAQNSDIPLSGPFISRLRSARDEYHDVVQEGSKRPVIDSIVKDFENRQAQTGMLDGDQVQRFRSRLLSLQRKAFGDPEYSEALGRYIDALDDEIQRVLPPADLAAWQQARRQYRNLITISKAAVGGGSEVAEGIITPARLRTALTGSERDRRAYARGQGDFSALAHAGNLAMSPLPNSGTSQREMARGFATVLGAGLGYLFGGPSEGIVAATVGALAGPGATGRAVMSDPVQAYLSGRLPGQATARAAGAALPGGAATLLRSVGPPLAAEDVQNLVSP